jgi:hypothetical protein
VLRSYRTTGSRWREKPEWIVGEHRHAALIQFLAEQHQHAARQLIGR